MMVPVPVVVLSPLGLAWILTRKKRTLPSKDKLHRRIRPGLLARLQDFMPRSSGYDVLETDAHFWRSSGGFMGLIQEHENAVCFVQLLQWYVIESNMDKQDVEYVSRRAFIIGFLILASIPEQAIRLCWWKMPHFCARWASYLYFEAASRTRTLNLEYGNGQLAV